MNDNRLAEAKEAEGKSLRTVDGVGQNGGRRCKVGQRVDCVQPSRNPLVFLTGKCGSDKKLEKAKSWVRFAVF